MKKDLLLKKISKLLEKIIEHNLFKPVVVSIITSFILFNGFAYLQNYLQDRKRSTTQDYSNYTPIKVNIPKRKDGFNLRENQAKVYEMKFGDTLLKVLLDIGASEGDIFNILSKLREVYNPKSINAGDKVLIKYQVKVLYDNKGSGIVGREVFISSIEINPEPEKRIIVSLTPNSSNEIRAYEAKEIKKSLTRHIIKYSAVIKNGLFVDGVDVGVSPTIMMNMINLYSFDVDFQREIRVGDKFEVLFESYYDESGNRVKDGNVLFASLDLRRRQTIDMYFYKTKKIAEYFDGKGKSIRKSLLRTPINGARISSGYGRRRHPVLGYTKIHKGIDFAAPRGTPIFAAGSGVITYYKRYGSYGNFVKIRHNNGYSTAYAHASRFARGLRVGSRVKQGDIIAYVGTTGRSTGPHLHYEVRFKGKQINPSKVKTTSGLKLSGAQLKNFMKRKAQIDEYLRTTPNQNKL